MKIVFVELNDWVLTLELVGWGGGSKDVIEVLVVNIGVCVVWGWV